MVCLKALVYICLYYSILFQPLSCFVSIVPCTILASALRWGGGQETASAPALWGRAVLKFSDVPLEIYWDFIEIHWNLLIMKFIEIYWDFIGFTWIYHLKGGLNHPRWGYNGDIMGIMGIWPMIIQLAVWRLWISLTGRIHLGGNCSHGTEWS